MKLLTGESGVRLADLATRHPEPAMLWAVHLDDVRLLAVDTGVALMTNPGRIDRFVPSPGVDWMAKVIMHANQYGFSADVWRLAERTDDEGERFFTPSLESMELVAGAHDCAVTPDGRWLATTEFLGPIRIWETATWTCVAMTWIDGDARNCGWLADASGLWVTGDRGVNIFDFQPLSVSHRDPATSEFDR